MTAPKNQARFPFVERGVRHQAAGEFADVSAETSAEANGNLPERTGDDPDFTPEDLDLIDAIWEDHQAGKLVFGGEDPGGESDGVDG